MKYKPSLDMKDLPDAGREWNVRPQDAKELMEYRALVLDSEEYKEAQKYIEDYQDAYQSKEDIGLFDEMELAEKYWSGDFGVPEDYDDPGSNTNIINTNIETQVAAMVDQTIDIEIKPYDPSDRDYVKQARMILDRIKDLNQLPKKIEDWERKKDKFGTGIFRVMYSKKLIKGLGCPEIKVVSPAYVYPDPNVTNIDDIQDCRYIVEVMPKSLYWAEQKFGKEKAWAIAPGYNPSETVFNENNFNMKEDHYLHVLYWCRHNGKLRLIQMSGCGVILSDSAKDSEYNYFTDDAKYPYFFTVDMRREGTIWGKSVCSLLFSLQDEIDDYTNQIRRNARLTGNPIKLVADTAGVEIDKLDNTAGQIIPVRDINGVKYLTPPSMASYIVERRNQAMNERVIVSRISDQQSGIKQSGVSTATESLALSQSAAVATDTRKLMLQYTLNDVFNYCFDLALNYWNMGMFFEGEDEEFEYFKPSDLLKIPVKKPVTSSYISRFRELNPDSEPPKYMLNSKEKRKIKLVFNIMVGAGLPQNKAVAFNYILEAFKGGLLSKEECRDLMIEYIHLPVSMSSNEVIDLEKKQIEYEMAMLESQIMQMNQPQPQQIMPTGQQQDSVQNMQEQPTQRTRAVANPRPNAVGRLEHENNMMGG